MLLLQASFTEYPYSLNLLDRRWKQFCLSTVITISVLNPLYHYTSFSLKVYFAFIICSTEVHCDFTFQLSPKKKPNGVGNPKHIPVFEFCFSRPGTSLSDSYNMHDLTCTVNHEIMLMFIFQLPAFYCVAVLFCNFESTYEEWHVCDAVVILDQDRAL